MRTYMRTGHDAGFVWMLEQGRASEDLKVDSYKNVSSAVKVWIQPQHDRAQLPLSFEWPQRWNMSEDIHAQH